MYSISERIRASRDKEMRNYAAKNPKEIADHAAMSRAMGITAIPINTEYGIDTSFWNGAISPHQADCNNPAIRVIIPKATEGWGLADAQYVPTWNASAVTTQKMGGYHFHRKGGDTKVQAEWFCGHAFPGIVMLDFEDTNIPATLSDWWQNYYIEQIITFFKTVQIIWGSWITPAYFKLYTGAWYWNPRFKNLNYLAKLAAVVPDIVVADYYTNPTLDPLKPMSPIMPRGWKTWWGWQYTSVGKVRGVFTNCDMNLFKV
jgi:GH25 family lysozyme M1 (1,4-beta-N-acetylmuramidase)